MCLGDVVQSRVAVHGGHPKGAPASRHGRGVRRGSLSDKLGKPILQVSFAIHGRPSEAEFNGDAGLDLREHCPNLIRRRLFHVLAIDREEDVPNLNLGEREREERARCAEAMQIHLQVPQGGTSSWLDREQAGQPCVASQQPEAVIVLSL